MNDPSSSRQRLVDLFESDREALTSYVRRKLYGDGGGEAEDIVSDVFLRLIERGDLLAQVEDLTAYFYGALARAVVDFFRRRQAPAEAAAAESDPGPDPEQSLAQTEDRERLAAALGQLPLAERAVWVAVEIEGFSFRELADSWEEPLGTLLSRKSRATRHLRRLLS